MFCEKCGEQKDKCSCPNEKIADKSGGFVKHGEAKLLGVVDKNGKKEEKLES